MGVLDNLGTLASSIVAAIVMFVFAILTYFITVFVVATGAGFAGYSPSGDFVTLAAAVLVAGSIVAGASPINAIAGSEDRR